MALLPKFVVTVQRPPDVSIRVYREASREAFKRVGETWFRDNMPDHFKTNSGPKYGYQRRSPSYLRRKAALAKQGIVRHGGRVPLVYTGQMEDAFKRAAAIRAFPTRCTVTMQAPRYVTFKPRGNQPNKVAEATRVLPSERRDFEDIHRLRTERAINDYRATRKTTIGA